MAFVDRPTSAAGWNVELVQRSGCPRRAARYYKTRPHLWFEDADVWLWVDGSVILTVTPETVVEKWLKKTDIAGFKHPSRDCAYEEAMRCIVKGKDDQHVLEEQMAAMAAEKFPAHWGLVETGLLARRNTPAIAKLNERWWYEIEHHSRRDQISLPFVCWQQGVALAGMKGSLIKHPWVDYRRHLG